MQIRPATPADAPAIKAFDEIARSQAARVAFIERSIQSDECLVAVVDKRVVAYAVLNYRFYDHGFVDMLYVHKDFRRRGVGSKLMRHVEERCRTVKLFTSTNQSNTPMQSMLAKLGYQRSGIIDNLDEGDPELIYIKRLRDGVV